MTSDYALEARGICKRYGTHSALTDVDLLAPAGRLHGLLGPNGAGKTTLMRVLLGLCRRDAGTVHLLGQPLDTTDGPLPEGVAGIVEAPALYPFMSGRRNLELLARLDGNSRKSAHVAIDRALERTGLSAHADSAVAAYSAGMRQRLALAGALLRSPRLLFLDEPTNSLDPAGAHDIRSVARALADEGTAVVLSSHDMAEVEALCAAITVIDRGRAVFSGSVAELRALAPAASYELHTSNDDQALAMATRRSGVRAARARAGGLELSADVDSLDAYVIELGCAGIAVRALERKARTLESLFLDLTNRTMAAAS